jgi:preprotein translocase subunit SecG
LGAISVVKMLSGLCYLPCRWIIKLLKIFWSRKCINLLKFKFKIMMTIFFIVVLILRYVANYIVPHERLNTIESVISNCFLCFHCSLGISYSRFYSHNSNFRVHGSCKTLHRTSSQFCYIFLVIRDRYFQYLK